MENQLQVFYNQEFGQVRTIIKNEEVWFVGKDVAEALGYSNTRDALTKHIDNEDRTYVAIHDGRQNRSMIIINESGLYSLVFSSKLPSAKKFKH
ncbi:Bro-N domain-containing protein [uncultured Megamonas sp.]|uniref:BRO-N domain-containing protein n=1 Tax=uncultured Megamonas sp. TaxID=286140 RepID=UPI0026701309|nr:Bro-N domain-containing protein [uncultured Megamonas sp.]